MIGARSSGKGTSNEAPAAIRNSLSLHPMRISRLRHAAFWLLLLPMALVVLPRHELHHCVLEGQTELRRHDAAHGHGPGDEAEHAEVQATCAICQLNVTLDVPPATTALGWLEGLVCVLPTPGTDDPETAPRHLLANRGPPLRA